MRWIKIDVTTPNKPAIVRAAAECGTTKDAAFAAFFRLFCWLDEQTADGRIETDRDEVDAVARLPGFAASLERSGWLVFEGTSMTVVNWGEHNGQSAKRRCMDAVRKAASRNRPATPPTPPRRGAK